MLGEHIGLGVGNDGRVGLENVPGKGSVQRSIELTLVELIRHG